MQPYINMAGAYKDRILNMDVKRWIKSHEGLKLKMYRDSVDKWTIGYGRNIEDNGITLQEAEFMFDNDFLRCKNELISYGWYACQPQNIQSALLNMCYNMGLSRLLGFKKMIAAIIERDYTKAAMEVMDSKWAKQVGDRAKDVALMMREGE